MIKVTPEDLVRYIYNETSEQKTASIKAALQTDWNLRESYDNLLNSFNHLNTLKFSPRPESVDKILEHASKKQAQITSH